jgi:hypothetical protein
VKENKSASILQYCLHTNANFIYRNTVCSNCTLLVSIFTITNTNVCYSKLTICIWLLLFAHKYSRKYKETCVSLCHFRRQCYISDCVIESQHWIFYIYLFTLFTFLTVIKKCNFFYINVNKGLPIWIGVILGSSQF